MLDDPRIEAVAGNADTGRTQRDAPGPSPGLANLDFL
jgi:hypothetical protein